ncbi:hypothetical protein GWI33_022605 [Rhynchophorus ferrugineus]|uniref:Uncharacterized protein n=1 Tax=Rhynchophorus ferrugineus TaxID=354439 RepID=A0A834M220_RHYFE|nr:hypothetical protein GWI33_022605 [Rhynchophorus ferrugineus]
MLEFSKRTLELCKLKASCSESITMSEFLEEKNSSAEKMFCGDRFPGYLNAMSSTDIRKTEELLMGELDRG